MNIKKTLVLAVVVCAGLGAVLARGQTKNKLDPESEKFYSAARLIMTSEESKIFKHLPDAESRREFIKDFWDKRDPDPGGDLNTYKAEFEQRVAYANKRFREGGLGINTDRGRIYVFMGPPDKVEEFMPSVNDPGVRGSVVWWIYYRDGLGIEFADERGNGAYRMRQHEGDFFAAMDRLKLGQWVGPDSVFKNRVVDFDVKYDPKAKELEAVLPAKLLTFKENEDGKFQLELDFVIYVYEEEGVKKETITDSRSFVTTVRELDDLKTVSFRFAHALPPGINFVDVIIKGKMRNSGKIRKIFDFKIKS